MLTQNFLNRLSNKVRGILAKSEFYAIIVFHALQFMQCYIFIEAQGTPLSADVSPISVFQTVIYLKIKR